MLTKKGEVIVIASAVVEEIDENLTIFDQSEDSNKNTKHDDRLYNQSQKLLGIFQTKQIKFIFILCKTK